MTPRTSPNFETACPKASLQSEMKTLLMLTSRNKIILNACFHTAYCHSIYCPFYALLYTRGTKKCFYFKPVKVREVFWQVEGFFISFLKGIKKSRSQHPTGSNSESQCLACLFSEKKLSSFRTSSFAHRLHSSISDAAVMGFCKSETHSYCVHIEISWCFT